MALTVLDTNKFDTWPKVLQHNAGAYGARHTAIRYKHYGIWQSYSWKDYLDNVKYLALGLLALGFQPGDKLLIIGDSAPEWYFAELAAQSIRGVSVGLYSDLSAIEIEHVARDSGAEFAMVEDQEQADKIESRARPVARPQGRRLLALQGLEQAGRAPTSSAFAPSMEMGRALRGRASRRFRAERRGRLRRRSLRSHLHIGHHRPSQGDHAQLSVTHDRVPLLH